MSSSDWGHLGVTPVSRCPWALPAQGYGPDWAALGQRPARRPRAGACGLGRTAWNKQGLGWVTDRHCHTGLIVNYIPLGETNYTQNVLVIPGREY